METLHWFDEEKRMEFAPARLFADILDELDEDHEDLWTKYKEEWGQQEHEYIRDCTASDLRFIISAWNDLSDKRKEYVAKCLGESDAMGIEHAIHGII